MSDLAFIGLIVWIGSLCAFLWLSFRNGEWDD